MKPCRLRSRAKLQRGAVFRVYVHNGLYIDVKESLSNALKQKCFLEREVRSLHKLELISVQLCKFMQKDNRKEHVCVHYG